MTQSGWELKAIPYAQSYLPERMIYAGGREDRFVPIVFVIYAIRVGDQWILVDPGCDELPGFEMQNFVLPVEALAQQGITKDTVTDIIITHAHHDHIDAVRHFPYSTVHIQQLEYAAGKDYIPSTCNVQLFADSTLVAGCIRVEKTGGHTLGSSVVLLQGKGKTWVLCADECYLHDCLEKQLLPGVSKNPDNSRAFLIRFAGPEYEVLMCHDPMCLDQELINGSIAGI